MVPGKWDTYDETYEDEVFRFDGSTTQIALSKAQKMALNTMYIKIMSPLMIPIGTAAQQLLIQMQ